MQVIIYYHNLLVKAEYKPLYRQYPAILILESQIKRLMTKQRGNETLEQKAQPEIVYRSVAKKEQEHVFSFNMTPAQAEFVKTYRKSINFSETFRKYLDSMIQAHSPTQ